MGSSNMKFLIKQHEIEPALNEPTIITVPKNSKLLKVHSSCGEHIYAWFLENVDNTHTETYHFYTIPTGWEIAQTHPIMIGFGTTVKYFNTVFIRDGEIVFHVFSTGPMLDNTTD